MTKAPAIPLTDTLRFIVENQMALAAAIEELSLWVRERGSIEVHQRVHDCLATLDVNAKVLAKEIAAIASTNDR